MAKKERLNEEAARNNNTPPILSDDDLITLNQMNDRNTQLPKPKDRRVQKERSYLD